VSAIRHLADLDLRGNQLLNALAQHVDTMPADVTAGRIVFHTESNRLFVGTSFGNWRALDGQNAGEALQGLYNRLDQMGVLGEDSNSETGEWKLGSAFTSRATKAELNAAIDNVRVGLESQIGMLGNTLSDLDSDLRAAIEAILADIVSANADNAAAHDVLAASVSAETAARIAGDAELAGQIDAAATAAAAAATAAITHADTVAAAAEAAAKAHTDAKISDLIAGAPEALDTLVEIAAALADSGDVAAVLTSQIADVDNRALNAVSVTKSVAGPFSETITHAFTGPVTVSVFDAEGYQVEVSTRVAADSVTIAGNAGAGETLTVVIAG
jgi:hypothetical protein